MISRRWSLVCAIVLPALSPPIARAQRGPEGTGSHTESAAGGQQALIEATSGEPKLNFAITPYIWMPSLSGNMGVRGTSTDVNATVADVLQHSDSIFGLMGGLDLSYGRALFQFNGAWMHVAVDDQRGRADNSATASLSADVKTDTAWLEFAGGWRFLDIPVDENNKRRFMLDGLLGARGTILDVDTRFTSSVDLTLPDGTMLQGGRARTISHGEDWLEPFLGGRIRWDFADDWSLNLRGDIGGFSIGPDRLAWQAIAGISYRFHIGTTEAAAVIGYRALGQDVENNGFKWDMVAHGPAIGLTISF